MDTTDSDIRKQFGRHIKIEMALRGMTLKDLAQASDMSITTCHSIIHGKPSKSLTRQNLIEILSTKPPLCGYQSQLECMKNLYSELLCSRNDSISTGKNEEKESY
jgi:hypothetical protein